MMTSPVYSFISENHKAGTLKDSLDKLSTLFAMRGSALKVYLSLMFEGWNTIPGLSDLLGLSEPTLYRVMKTLLKQDLISVVGYQRASNRGGPDTRVFNVREKIR